MAFLEIGANSASDFSISNSLRFNDGDAPALSRDPSSEGNRRTFTISAWVKLSKPGNVDEGIFNSNVDSADNRFVFGITSAGQLNIYNRIGGTTYSLASNNLLRDPSAWYHCHCVIDTTDGTEADRQRMYINGTRVTSFADNSPVTSQNVETAVNRDDTKHAVGDKQWSADHFDGYMAEHYFLDGASKEPTDFAETNDNGVWVPKKYTGGSYGTNGHFFEFKQTGTDADASGIGADTSGNGNHYTVANLAATDVTTDTPTNNFATFNPLDNYYQQYTYAEGNLQVSTNADYYNWNTSTIGVNSGKWYVEGKMTQTGTGTDNWVFGVASYQVSNNNHGLGADNFGIAYRNNGVYKTGDANTTHGASFSANDIVMIALDLDNDNVYFGHGGQWADGSGNTDESSPNSAVSLSNLRGSSTYGDTVFFAFGDWNSNAASTVSIGEFNFGNPVHSISSGNADANGYGNFEYAPPSGYYALCTKNLAKYG